MKFTLSWLKRFLDTQVDLQTLLHGLTMAGLEVEAVDNPAARLKAFSIAKVIAAEPHPDADKLRVCTVQTRDGTKQIVCGAPNARAGMTAVYAPLGTYIPGLDMTLDAKPRKIRGVESHGMLCSSRELEIGEDHDGIMDLEAGLAMGQPLAEALGLDDPMIEIEVTPNRPDWLGVVGIARDLAAAGLGRFRQPVIDPVAGTFDCPVDIRIEAPDACPVFAGRLVRGVRNGPSPDWLQRTLKSVGLRPINALVDITNLISLERARPLHVYDAGKLTGAITARMGREGERFAALDGKTYTPTSTQCVIADDTGPLGFGGIMGGEASGCTADTVDVFIESAWFEPLGIARTGRSTGIASDARQRFERGVDPSSHLEGLEYATGLILELCGGEASHVRVAGQAPIAPGPRAFRPARVRSLTGMDVPETRIEDILTKLGFAVETGETWTVTPPSWRGDVEGEADLVEEVARIEGFDKMPSTPLPPIEGRTPLVVTPLQNRVRLARRVMAARGFLEAVTWSFMARPHADLFGGGSDALTLANPIASDLDAMRPSILANLAQAAQRASDRGAGEVALFEAGPIYLDDSPTGQRTVLAALVRPKPARSWRGAGTAYDVFSIKADLFAALEALGADPARMGVFEAEGSHYHPGQSASLRLGPKKVIASFGALHPRVLKALDVEGEAFCFELDLDAMPYPKTKAGKTKPALVLADQTPVRRDFAFVVGEAVPAGEIVKAALGADKALIEAVSVFDVYRGPGLGQNEKSVAIETVLQPRERTLTDEEIEAVSQAIIAAVTKASGGRLR
jgi:phenylalanyl-tRNA synthetase beta chain